MQLLYEKNATIGVYFFYPQLFRAIIFTKKKQSGPLDRAYSIAFPSLVVVGRGTLGSGRDKVYMAVPVIAHRFGND